MEERRLNLESLDPVAIIDTSLQDQPRVPRHCPQCGNHEAFSWSSQITGEHAGVRQERTLKRFKCTRCLHAWTESY
jgi:DNA-directed RNA polymerase subunit M/transcription elongation factor TFIIS